MDDALMPDR